MRVAERAEGLFQSAQELLVSGGGISRLEGLGEMGEPGPGNRDAEHFFRDQLESSTRVAAKTLVGNEVEPVGADTSLLLLGQPDVKQHLAAHIPDRVR